MNPLFGTREVQPYMPLRCHQCCPEAGAISLVAQRDRSVASLSCLITSGLTPSPSSRSLSKSVWYACMMAIVCRDAPAQLSAIYALPTKPDIVLHGLLSIVRLSGMMQRLGKDKRFMSLPSMASSHSRSLLSP